MEAEAGGRTRGWKVMHGCGSWSGEMIGTSHHFYFGAVKKVRPSARRVCSAAVWDKVESTCSSCLVGGGLGFSSLLGPDLKGTRHKLDPWPIEVVMSRYSMGGGERRRRRDEQTTRPITAFDKDGEALNQMSCGPEKCASEVVVLPVIVYCK
jgi:hypothetical protein